MLPSNGGVIEIIDGTHTHTHTHNVGSKNLGGSGKSYTFKGTSKYFCSVRNWTFLTQHNSDNYWYNNFNSLVIQSLLIRHTWNVSFTGSVNNAKALIYASQNTSITIDGVIFNTLYPTLLLSQCIVIYARNS
jgi:hypothetical protein